MYCVRFKSNEYGVGYFRPWNSVRDGETYSMTYLIPSIIDGISIQRFNGAKILRHKLRFNGSTKELFKSESIARKRIPTKEGDFFRETGISTIHQLMGVEILLGFERLEDAEYASKNVIFAGQRQYMLFPTKFYDSGKESIVELNDEEFSALQGTETFQVDEEEGVYCGNNRFRNNERMYIKIVRTK